MYTHDEERRILYYPSIKIYNREWISNAILYWDKVSSIVPSSNYNETNTRLVEELQQAELYEAIYPFELGDNQELCTQFCKEVKKNLEYYKKKEAKYKRKMEYLNQNQMSRIHVEKLSMLHIDKTPTSILDFLFEEELIEKNCDGPWMYMGTLEADIYMATLAKYLARTHGNTEIGTDKRREFWYPYEKKTLKKGVERQVYLDVVLQDILPIPREKEIEDIIEFKRKYKRELQAFRRRIDGFKLDLQYSNTIEEMQERASLFQKEIDYDLNEVEEVLHQEKKEFVKGAVRTLIPIGVMSAIEIAELFGGLSPMEAIGVEAGASIIMPILCSSKIFERQTTDVNAYLLSASKKGIIHTSRNYHVNNI